MPAGQEEKLHESGWGTYQGLPIISGQMSRTPGFGPDHGHVLVLIRNFEALKVQVQRPMFNANARSEDATTTISDVSGPIIDGYTTALTQKGPLIFKSDEGAVALENIYIREDGLEEIASYEDPDNKNYVISVVRINLVDEREWWTKRGYVFGAFNKVGVDGRHIAATGNPANNNNPWTLQELVEIGCANLCTKNKLRGLQFFNAREQSQAKPPIEKDPRFMAPAHFLSELFNEAKLLPIYHLNRELSGIAFGVGKSLNELALPDDKMEQNFVVVTPNYYPDAALVYCEYPTTQEVEFELSGYDTMELIDPRTGDSVPWQDALPYYGLTIKAFFKLGTARDSSFIKKAMKWIAPYLRAGGLQDHELDPFIKKQPHQLRNEAERRANILHQCAFKHFRVPEEHFPKLPFEDALLTETGDDTSLGTDEEDPKSAAPKPIHVSVLTYQKRTYSSGTDEEQNPDEEESAEDVYYTNPGTFLEMDAGPTTFRVESRTGIIKFDERVGQLYQEKLSGAGGGAAAANLAGAVANLVIPGFGVFITAPSLIGQTEQAAGLFEIGDVPKFTPTDTDAGAVLEIFFLKPPPTIKLRIAHTLHGTRDLRSAPGQRSKFPTNVAKINLQHCKSPEDYYLQSFIAPGTRVQLEDIDTLYPYVEQVRQGRKLISFNKDSEVVAERDKLINETGERLTKPLWENLDSVAARNIVACGIYPIECDGITHQVTWKVTNDGHATTSITMGSLRLVGPVGTINYAAKSFQFQTLQNAAKQAAPARNKTSDTGIPGIGPWS